MIILDIFFGLFSSSIIGYAFSKPLNSKANGILTVLLYSVPLVTVNLLFNFSSTVESLIPDYSTRMNIKMILVTLCWFSYFIFLFKDSLKRKLFVFFVMAVCNFLTEALFGFIISKLLNVNSVEARSLSGGSRIVYYLVATIGYFVFSYLGYLICSKKKLNISMPVLINFGAIIMANIIMGLTAINVFAFTNNLFSQITLLLLPVLILVLSFSLYGIMKKLSDQEIIKEKLYWTKNVKSLELEYYNNLQQKSNEVRKIRHDFKDNIDTVKLLVDENTEESIRLAKEILSSLDNSIKAAKIPVYTENLVVNTVVGAKAEEANRAGITLNAAIDIPHELGFESIDLNCVFLNLLNNAIESCKKLPDGENKEITLKAAVKAGYLIIKTENPYISLDTDNSGKIKTSKTDKENHGFGMTLINDIAQKYDGNFETKTENGIFTAILSLKI